MELNTFPAIFLLLPTVLLPLLLCPVSGKCHGKWAIHACLGGNGKRSDPSLSTDDVVSSNLESRLRSRLESSEPSSKAKLIALLKADLPPRVEPPSRHSALGYRSSPWVRSNSEASLLHRLLFTDVARILQEDELSREKAATSLPEGVFNKESTGDHPLPEEPVDIDALRSFIAALKLEHLLRAQSSRLESRDDQMLL